MPPVTVRDMDTRDERFVGTCSHVNESAEMDTCCERRIHWFQRNYHRGLRVKVAEVERNLCGFIYVMPIEISPWGPLGSDLMVIPCLYVLPDQQHYGAGKALIDAAVDEARTQGRKGVCVIAYHHDSWFMPAPFFESCGFKEARRQNSTAILWKLFDSEVDIPELLHRKFTFEAQNGKVVVDLFFNSFCATSDIEAQRVREVASEFGDRVVLKEHSADEREALLCHQTPRGIFVNGQEIFWGFEAPREGIRDAIRKAMGE